MNRIFAITVTMGLTAAAGATYYVDERFEGTFPPTAWRVVSGQWVQEDAGPWGNYAFGIAFTTGQSPVYATFETPPFTAGAGRTVYWQFHHSQDTMGVPAGRGAKFYIRYDVSGEEITSLALPLGEWMNCAGSVEVPLSNAVRAGFSVWVVAYPNHSAYAFLSVDNVRFADASMSAVAPTSLGRVKALYR